MKSISDCLNRVDNMIFQKSLKCLVKGNLEDIRKHIEWKLADVVTRTEYLEDKQVVLSVLSRINHIIERFYTNGSEEDLDEQNNKLRQRILEWYEEICTKPEVDNRE